MKSGTKEPALSKSALRRKREKEQRYETILRAAEALFVEEGYHQTSVEQIADQAEVSVGTVYFYFKNKEALLLRLFEEGVYTLRVTLGSAFREAGASLSGFEQAGHAFFDDFCVNHYSKVTILFKEVVGQSRKVEARRRELFETVIEDVQGAILKMGHEMGFDYKSRHSARVITVGILGIYERVAYQYLMWPDETGADDLKIIGRDAVSFIMGGVSSLEARK